MQGSDTGLPVGTIITWPTANWQQDMKTAGGKPDNFLLCNGQSVDASKYPKLAKIMAAVPNYQGLFLRGYGSQSFAQVNGSLNGTTSTTYSSNNIGNIQGDAIRNIYGYFGYFNDCNGTVQNSAFYMQRVSSSAHEGGSAGVDWRIHFDANRIVPTAEENRPINTAVIYLVRAK